MNYKYLMKNTFASFNVKKIRINERILLVLGIIFIVSPGWILGLYWMRYQKLPWEREIAQDEKISSEEDQEATEDVEVVKGALTEEEKLQAAVKNDLFLEYPFDMKAGTIYTNGLFEKDISSYIFKKDHLIIDGKKYPFTNHTEMFGDKKSIDIEEGLELLKKNTEIELLVYTVEGNYVESITFK